MLPYRACLLKVSSRRGDEEVGITGCRYEVVRDVPGKPILIKLLGYPGDQCTIKLTGTVARAKRLRSTAVLPPTCSTERLSRYSLAERSSPGLFIARSARWRHVPVPGDAAALYEATCFAADSNALEVRSLQRSGPTSIPVVKAARDAFFNQPIFVERALWDKNLFDGSLATGLAICRRWEDGQKSTPRAFRLDLGERVHLDKLIIQSPDEFCLQPFHFEEGAEAMVSPDLLNWTSIRFVTGKRMELDLSKVDTVRYVMVKPAFARITEIAGLDKDGRAGR